MPKIFKSREDMYATLKNALFVILGAIVLALGVGLFIKPFSLVTGGVAGLSIILSTFLPDVMIGEVNMIMEICSTALTWILFFIGLFLLGKTFAAKTLLSSIVYTVMLPVVTYLSESEAFGTFFDISEGWTAEAGNYSLPIIAAVFGGVLIGVGCALTFRGGGSTGGLDILALVVVKYVKRAKSSVMVFVFDASVVVFGAFAIGDFIMCLLGVTSAFIVAIVIDKVFLGASKAFIANVVSERYEEIRTAIITKLDRTCTIISAKGGYTDIDRPMLMVSFTMPQYVPFLAIIKSIDKNAFVTIHRAHEIDGEGFTRYDVKLKK